MTYPPEVAVLAKKALDAQKDLIDMRINERQMREVYEGAKARTTQANREYLLACEALDKAVEEWCRPKVSMQPPPGAHSDPPAARLTRAEVEPALLAQQIRQAVETLGEHDPARFKVE